MSLCQSESWSWQTRQDCLHWTPTSVCNNNKSTLNYPSCAGKFSDRHYCLSVHNDYLLRSKCILAWPGWLNTPSKSQLLSIVEICTNSSISLYQWFHYSLMNEYLQLVTLNSDQFIAKVFMRKRPHDWNNEIPFFFQIWAAADGYKSHTIIRLATSGEYHALPSSNHQVRNSCTLYV